MNPLPDTDPYGAQRRALTVVYEDEPDVRVWVVDGLTTDDNLIRLYQHAVDVHTDAWMLKRAQMLPEWWRLVREVRIDNLRDETPHYRVAHPLGEAAVRLTGLTPAEISHTVNGWRVQRTRQAGEGRIVKVRERRTTGTMKPGRPDMRIRHREAFAPTREQARVDIPPPAITFEGFDLDVSRVRVQVVGPYTLLPQERIAA